VGSRPTRRSAPVHSVRRDVCAANSIRLQIGGLAESTLQPTGVGPRGGEDMSVLTFKSVEYDPTGKVAAGENLRE
jgi:hypothetical protein